MSAKRQIVLDTETTGLDPKLGHRIIEIGCVELINRCPTGNDWHHYFNPHRVIEDEAIAVHGITNEFLQDKPAFHQLAELFMDYLNGAELIIHNAGFDVSFLNHELNLLSSNPWGRIDECCSIIDTLEMARRLHPGQRNSLDALCKRYHVNNAHRELHGGLLDAGILADVYLAMTGGQISMLLGDEPTTQQSTTETSSRARVNRLGMEFVVVKASAEELTAHEAFVSGLKR
jgi:DNA polymerase-3 subunit epsilon